jgi:hypothetical protein
VKKAASKSGSGSGNGKASGSGSGSAKPNGSKSQANASSNGPKLTLDHMFAAQSGNKRALSPTTTLGNEVTPSKRFKNEVIIPFSRPSPPGLIAGADHLPLAI